MKRIKVFLLVGIFSSSCINGVISSSGGSSSSELNFDKAIQFNGSDLVSLSHSPVSYVASEAFTIDARIIRAAAGSQHTVYGRVTTGGAMIGMQVSSLNKLVLITPFTVCSTNNGATGSTGIISTSVKYHVSIEYDGVNVRYYINGNLDSTTAISAPPACTFNSGNVAYGAGVYFNGVIDEVRYSNIARYGGVSFTPPAVPYTVDGNTLFLYHMNDAATSGTITTASPSVGFSFAGLPSYISSPFP